MSVPTPLLLAVYRGETDAIAAALGGRPAPTLFEAAALGDAARVRELAGANAAAVERRSPDGWPPLLHAALAGRAGARIVSRLLTRGAEVNARAAGDHTALHEAAFRGNLELAQLLLAHGADATLRNGEGQTALDVAQAKGHAALARRLRGELP